MVVRHGETEWSATGRHTGRTDVLLTDRGREQARALAARLGRHRFVCVLTSPLERAAETCRLAGFGDVARDCGDLAEWDYGDYEGVTRAEIRARRPGWSLWDDGPASGETVEEVGRRADRVIATVRPLGGDALLFAHGHILRVLAARWVGLPPGDGGLFALDPAGIGVLGYEHEVPVLMHWNEREEEDSP